MNSHDWDARYASTDLLWGHGPNRFVRAELDGLEPGRALDLACGEGRNAIWLAEQGWQVTGIDFSPVAIDRARRLAAERGVSARFEVGNALTASEQDMSLVVLAYLQLPPEERSAAVAIARDALAPGGTFLLVGHDRRNHLEGVGGPSDPTLLWQLAEILGSLDGFEIERATVVERPVDGAPRPALDTLVKARRPASAPETARAPSPHRAERGDSPGR